MYNRFYYKNTTKDKYHSDNQSFSWKFYEYAKELNKLRDGDVQGYLMVICWGGKVPVRNVSILKENVS